MAATSNIQPAAVAAGAVESSAEGSGRPEVGGPPGGGGAAAAAVAAAEAAEEQPGSGGLHHILLGDGPGPRVGVDFVDPEVRAPRSDYIQVTS